MKYAKGRDSARLGCLLLGGALQKYNKWFSGFGWLMVVAVMVVPAALPGTVRAADFLMTPSLKGFAQYNDNIGFSRADVLEDSVYTVVPGLKLDYDDAKTKLLADMKVAIDRYQSEKDYDNEFYNVQIDARHNLTQRLKLNGEFEFTKDTTLESELAETGRIQFREDRYRYDAGGGVNYNLTELVNLSLNYRYNNIDYKSDTKVDYNRHQARIALGRLLKTQVDRIYMAPVYSQRDSDESRVNNYSLNFGWQHGLSETYNLKLELGARYTETDNKIGDDKDYTWGGQVNFRFFRRTERSDIDFSYTRGLATTAEGQEVDVDRVRAYFNLALAERLRFSVDGRFFYTKDEKEDDNVYTRYFEIQPSMLYRMTANSTLVLNYTYSLEYDEEQAPEERAERNRVWLGVAFYFPYRP